MTTTATKNRIVRTVHISGSSYEYYFASGDVIQTCGNAPALVFDAGRNYENGNCYLNGDLCRLSYALDKINATL